MKHLSKRFLFSLIIILFYNSIYCCCTCIKSTNTFVDDLEKYEFVGIVEVIKKDSIIKNEIDYTFTIVKVISQFTGKFFGQTFRIIDAKGFGCITSLGNNQIGSKSIIKGNFSSRSNWDFEYGNLGQREEYVLYLGLCDMNQLSIDISENNVLGFLTFNNLVSKIRRDYFINKGSTANLMEMLNLGYGIYNRFF